MTAMPAASMRARTSARFIRPWLVFIFFKTSRMTPTAAMTVSRSRRKGRK